MGDRACPKCGYLLQPFDTDCPKCARLKAEGKPAEPTAPPGQRPAAAARAPEPASRVWGVPKAGFWIRFVAAIIDGIALFFVNGILGFMVLAAAGPEKAQPVMAAISFLMGIAYAVVLIAAYGQTVGMLALGIMVVKTDGSKVNYLWSFVRYLGNWVSALPCGLGYLWIAFDPNKQAWHDKIADTYVVRA